MNKYKDFGLVVFSYGTQFIGGLLLTKILTMYLNKDMFGEFSLFQSLAALIFVLPFTSLNEGASRLQSEYFNNSKEKLFCSYAHSLNVYFALPYLFLSLLLGYFNIAASRIELIIFSIYIISEIFRLTSIKIYNTAEIRDIPALINFITFFLRICTILIFSLFSDLSILTIFSFFAFSNFLSIIIAFSGSKYRPVLKLPREIFPYFLENVKFSSPLIIWGFFTWLQNMSGRWIIKFLLDDSNVAEFAFIQSLAIIPITAITSILGTYYIPKIYLNHYKNSNYSFSIAKRLIPYIFLVYISLILFSFIFSNFLIVLLSSDKYLNIATIFPFIFIGSLFQSVGVIFSYPAYAYQKTNRLLVSGIMPGILNLALNFILVPKWGVAGAIASFILSSILYFSMTLFLFHKLKAEQN